MKFDAIIVGAGPAGLLTAIELAVGGVRPLVLERLDSINPVTKALAVGPLGVEALQRRGMSDAIAIAETQSPLYKARRGGRSNISGHFAGLSMIRRGAQNEPERSLCPIDQQAVEAILGERARALGIEIRRKCEVTGFREFGDGIEVSWTGGSARCSYLVGCDGGRSAIRKLAGFDFPGTPPTMTMYQAAAEYDRPDLLGPRGWQRTEAGVFSNGFLPGRIALLDFSGPPEDREAPVTREEIEEVVRRISGKDIRVTAVHGASRWADNSRLVDSYRRGRVLLAGDAAHVHSPFGGQGLSLGLVDAANLGWKLAAVIRGDMPDSLLDTYTAERRPVAEAVLANTMAQLALLRPDPQSGALRNLFARLLDFDDVNRLIGEMMTGLSNRYDLGSDHDEVGRLSGDPALFDLMQDGNGVLLDASNGKLSRRVKSPRIRCVGIENGPSKLIRPDGCIAWVGEEHGLLEALSRWFG